MSDISDKINLRGVFLSIVIPTYNNGEFLQHCLDSILDIKSVSYEVIVINDGSQDDTEKILMNYGSQIIVVNQDNKGVSAARNVGISMAKGQYLWFIDSDDTIDAEQFDLVMRSVIKTKEYMDIIGFGYAMEFYKNDVQVSKNTVFPYWSKLSSKEECFNELFKSSYGIGVDDYERWCKGCKLKEYKLKGFTWWMIFKKDIIEQNHIRFSEKLHYNEDSIFLSEVFMNCNNAVFYDNIVYHYARRGIGATVIVFNNDKMMALNKMSLFEEKISIAKRHRAKK